MSDQVVMAALFCLVGWLCFGGSLIRSNQGHGRGLALMGGTLNAVGLIIVLFYLMASQS